MRASTKRILSIMISASLLIAVMIIYVKLIQPAYSDIQNLRGEIQARNNLLEEQNHAVNQVQNLISQHHYCSYFAFKLFFCAENMGIILSKLYNSK